MNKKGWFLIALAFSITWGLDRVTKMWALQLPLSKHFGFFEFSLHYNPGAILGLFSSLPPVLRIVTLSTGGAFLIFSFFMLQYLIPIRAMSIRVGMALLLGGILGNVADRIAWGHVVDFIIIKAGKWNSPVFNVADAIQWIGHMSVIYGLFKYADTFWPEKNTRKSNWVNFKFQIKYCLLLIAVGTGIGIVSGTFAYTYLRVTIISLTGENPFILDKFLIPFTLSFAAISGVFIMVLFLVGKAISHRVAGPVFAFENYLNNLMNGKFYSFKVRRSDEFQHLSVIGDKIKTHLEKVIPKSPEPIKKEEIDYNTEELTPAPEQENPPLAIGTQKLFDEEITYKTDVIKNNSNQTPELPPDELTQQNPENKKDDKAG